nr:aldehyde dehydrogenase family protein [Bacteroidota bacterium]
MALEVVNPFTNKKVKELAEYTDYNILTAISNGNEAYKSWGKTSFQDRAFLMKKAAALLEENKISYAKIITEEMGKTTREAIAEIEKCALVCNHYANHTAIYLEDEKVKLGDKEAIICYEPLGIIFAIMPWNFPFWQVFRFAAPTLMAGNGALLKHASNVPQC